MQRLIIGKVKLLIGRISKLTTQIQFGLYRNEDLKLVLNHKSYCMIIFGGSDTFITDNRNPHISRGRIFFLNQIKQQMLKNKKIVLIAQSKWISNDLNRMQLSHYTIPWYSLNKKLFHPVNKGINIYVYKRYNPFYSSTLINKLEKQLGHKYKFITANGNIPYNKISEIYSKSFIGLRLVPHDGLGSTVQELGLMGIKCVHNGSSPSALKYRNVDDIIKHIENEAKTIGLKDEELSKKVEKYLTIPDNFFKVSTYFR